MNRSANALDATTEPGPLRPGVRCRVATGTGATLSRDAAPGSPSLAALETDTLVVCAEVRAGRGGPDRVRIASPAGWLDADALEVVGPAPSIALDRETFLERHLDVAPGDHYGLPFPISLDGLRAAGAAFLTEAFRASGVLSDDNRVTEIASLETLGHNGASDAALLSVVYASPAADLHTDLFVKVSPPDLERKYTVAAMAQGEITINRRAADIDLPVPVARYYFGDYCRETANFLLITERIPFGEDPIEPAWTKGYEQHVPDVVDHYRVLAESLARVVAAHKRGAMGSDLERDFPFGRSGRRFPPIVDVESRLDWLIDFIARVAPQLFVAEAGSDSFLTKFREDVLFGVAHDKDIARYLLRQVDYTGLCHPNLNIDNAWYWRDASGRRRVGWLDLGGFGQMSVAQALNSMPMMSEPDRYPELARVILSTFAETCEAEGGPSLDREELRLQFRAAVLSVSLGLILGGADTFLSPFTEEEWATMASWSDPRLQESGTAVAIVWIDNVLRGWLEDPTPGDAWREIVRRLAD